MVLAYVLYGDNSEYELEFLMSAFSALRCAGANGRSDIQICLVTDRPRFEPGFQFTTLLIEPSQLKSWTQTPGGIYYHRLKIHALRMAPEHFKSKVALVDTDSYFVGRPQQLLERISPDSTVMHARECTSIGSNSELEPLFVAPRRKLQIAGIEISRKTGMYNSGVIGIDASHAPLLRTALEVLDDLYARAPVFNVEQFAVTAVPATPVEFAGRLADAQMPVLGEPQVRFLDRLSGIEDAVQRYYVAEA